MQELNRIMNQMQTLFAVAVLIMALPVPAAAYIDPGSGTMLWQLGAAALFGALFQIKRVAGWFRRRAMPDTTAAEKPAAANREPMS